MRFIFYLGMVMISCIDLATTDNEEVNPQSKAITLDDANDDSEDSDGGDEENSTNTAEETSSQTETNTSTDSETDTETETESTDTETAGPYYCGGEPQICADIGATPEEQFYGCCQGDISYWCQDGALQSMDCISYGGFCGYDAEFDYVTCMG